MRRRRGEPRGEVVRRRAGRGRSACVGVWWVELVLVHGEDGGRVEGRGVECEGGEVEDGDEECADREENEGDDEEEDVVHISMKLAGEQT